MTQPANTARYEIVYSEPAGELLVDNERGMVWQLSDYFIPSRAWLDSLCTGKVAPNCFGELRYVMEVSFHGVNIDGKGYVGVYLHNGETSTISASYTEDRLHLSLLITNRHTSQELHHIEKFLLARDA